MFFGANSGGTAARRARRSGPTHGLALIVVAAAGIGTTGLGAAAWTTPTVVAVTRPARVHQQVTMTYAATTTRSAAYPTAAVRTGDPVFLRLVPRMTVRIAYRVAPGVEGALASGLHGTRRVTAELRAANGWHRGFELLPRKAFTGNKFNATADLDLARVWGLITGMTQATGIAGQTYTLSVRNEIALAGSLDDQVGPTDGYGTRSRTSLRDSFFPELTFRYDGRQMQLDEPLDRSAFDRPISGVIRQQVSDLRIAGTAYGHLDLLGQELPVPPLRRGGLVVGLVLLLIAALGQRSRSKESKQRTRTEATRTATPGRRTTTEVPARRTTNEPPSRRAAPAPAPATSTSTSTRRIVLDEPPVRVPVQRSAATAQRHWARTHPTARERG